jgi:DNA-directed RNA polymerase specialized sigma24 family protein
MEKHSKISLLASDKTIYDYAFKVAKGNDLYKDIVSEILIYLYDLPQDKFDKINDLKSYVCKMIYFSWNSSTSPFYKKFRNDNDYKIKEDVSFELDDATEELEQIEIRMSKKKYPIDIRLFELYTELGTYRAVGNVLGLPHRNIHYRIQKVIEEMKKKI